MFFVVSYKNGHSHLMVVQENQMVTQKGNGLHVPMLVLEPAYRQDVSSCLHVTSPRYLQMNLVRTALYILLRPSLNFKLEDIFSLIHMITKFTIN